jgi:hypothetical protein
MSQTTVTITDTRRIVSPDPQRLSKQDLIVLYTDGQGRRGSVRVPAESATDATVTAAIKADLAERGKWQTKTLTIS